MKRSTLQAGAAAIALVCCAACDAQSSAQEAQRESDEPVTLSGCLEGGGNGGTPGAGNAGNTSRRASGSAGERFTLINAGDTTHMLNGNADELRAHVNQQVEVTGRLSPIPDTVNSRDGARQTAGDSGEPVGRSPLRDQIRVESVRMLAASCLK